MKRIFIGGLGRSGTTILLHAMYCHGDIYAVPIETKFLVEEDGFDDLIAALTTRFTPTGAATALARFRHLMYRQVTGLVSSKFREQEHLPSDVFQDYEQALEDFMGGLSDAALYHPDRTVLLDLTRRFIASLFDTETIRSDKLVWAEKTPSNYWRLEFLRELWPDCYFVHAVRDPRDVFMSLMHRKWLPENVGHSLNIFATQVQALLEHRRRRVDDPRFIEVRLEDLVSEPARTLCRLADSLALEPFSERAVTDIVRSMERYYAGQTALGVTLTGPERRRINELLCEARDEFGYQDAWRPRDENGEVK
jgi:hypothetical protein